MKTWNSRRGYTLTELMIAIAVMGTISTIGPTLMRNLQTFYLQSGARNDIERDARASLDIIDRELRQAKYSSIILDAAKGEPPFSRIRFTHVNGNNMSFYQQGGTLFMSNGTDVTKLTSNLVYIAFTFPQTDNPTIVSVAMSMGKQVQLGKRMVLELTIQKVRIMN